METHTPTSPAGPAARRLLWLALMLLAPVMAAQPCRPIPADRPMAAAPRDDFSRGLLWKIETPDAQPSYLFGTFHSGDPRITTLPCPVQQAFDAAGSYTMEMIFNGSSITSMAEAMFFSDGRTLRQVLGDPLYRDMLDALGIRDTKHAAGIEHMKPWAVMMTLMGPRESGGLFLDMALQARAVLHGKANHALETADEQIAVFNGMSIDDQVVLLRDAIENARTSDGALEELTQAYLKRDLDGLQAIQDKYKPADARVYSDMTKRLLTERNRNMAERMRARLKEGNAFIAVGALHLAGDSGLLRLLANDGYRLTRIY
jgi:hypothetical protein